MRRDGSRAIASEQVPITPDHSELLMLEFDLHGRIAAVGVVRGNLALETAAGREARLLIEGVAGRLRVAGTVQELLARARLALDLIENLAALEEMHGDAARRLLAPHSPAPIGSR